MSFKLEQKFIEQGIISKIFLNRIKMKEKHLLGKNMVIFAKHTNKVFSKLSSI